MERVRLDYATSQVTTSILRGFLDTAYQIQQGASPLRSLLTAQARRRWDYFGDGLGLGEDGERSLSTLPAVGNDLTLLLGVNGDVRGRSSVRFRAGSPGLSRGAEGNSPTSDISDPDSKSSGSPSTSSCDSPTSSFSASSPVTSLGGLGRGGESGAERSCLSAVGAAEEKSRPPIRPSAKSSSSPSDFTRSARSSAVTLTPWLCRRRCETQRRSKRR